jgi:HSP20 family protein
MRDLIRRGRSQTDLNPLDRLFGDLLQPFAEQNLRQSWMPAVNIEETDEAYQVSAELPGLRPEDVEITVEQNVLTISGERKWGDEEDNRNFHRVERGYGRFLRTFALPQQVAADRVQASFNNGVLEITIPKAEGARPRRIQIREGSSSGRTTVQPEPTRGAKGSGKQVS